MLQSQCDASVTFIERLCWKLECRVDKTIRMGNDVK